MKLLSTKASDWCSFWPDRCISYDYSACCEQHDRDYENPEISRWEADVALLICVNKHSNSFMATIMFIGVRCLRWAFKHYVTKGAINEQSKT